MNTRHLLAIAFAIAAVTTSTQGQLVPTNVALNKPTAGDVAFGAPTSRGNDGVDGIQSAANWTHADYPTSAVPYPGEVDPAPNPFWQVDLEGSFDITHLELVDRVGCCAPNRLNISTITLFDDAMDPVGAPIDVDGLFDSSLPDEATLSFDNAGLGWTGVAHIRIDGDEFNQYFQFSEFRAFSDQPPGPGNAALGRLVTASADTWGGQPPSHLTDGVFTTTSHPLADFDTLGFTYTVDLNQTYNLESVVLHNRRGCCPERLSNYRVSLHDDDGNGAPGPPLWSADIRTDFSHSGDGGRDTLTADLDPAGTFAGQFIVVENLSDDPYNPQIAELEAFTRDEILPPPPPPPPPGPGDNLATGKLAELYDFDGFPVPPWGQFPVANINDGNYETISHPLDEFSDDYYFEIDLEADTAIGSIELTGRGYYDACCPERLLDPTVIIVNDAGAEVFKTELFADFIDNKSELIDLEAAPVTGRYVRVVNTAFIGYAPQLGEIAIFAPGGGGSPGPTTDFRITAITPVDLAAGTFSITFTSEDDAIYSIWADDDLVGPWVNVEDFVESTGTSTTVTFTDLTGAGSPVRYFHVTKNPAP